MGRASAAIGSAIFFLAAPGMVAFVIPFLLAQGQAEGAPVVDSPWLRYAGLALGIAGTAALVNASPGSRWWVAGHPHPSRRPSGWS